MYAHARTRTNELLDTDKTRDRYQALRARVRGVPGAISCQGTPTPLWALIHAIHSATNTPTLPPALSTSDSRGRFQTLPFPFDQLLPAALPETVKDGLRSVHKRTRE